MAFAAQDTPARPSMAFGSDEVALFLDLDGTLARFESNPRAVAPDALRTALLRRAGEALAGRLAVISGRTLDEIDRILETSVASAAGVHGLERRNAAGVVQSSAPHPGLSSASAGLANFAQVDPGLTVEHKGVAVALHYRNAPSQAAEALALGERLAAESGLTVQRGDQVVELRTPGADKGDAVRAFMAEPPFAGKHPLFVGDDLTDEAAFEAVRDLGGAGVLVGRARPTQALGRLAGVPEVFGWIQRSLDQGRFCVERPA